MGCSCKCMLCGQLPDKEQITIVIQDKRSYESQADLPKIYQAEASKSFQVPTTLQYQTTKCFMSERKISQPAQPVPQQDEFISYQQILLEGELMKYNPGISHHFIPRWCRLTNLGFFYYKNLLASENPPLFFLPANKILKAQKQNLVRTQFYVPEKQEKFKKSNNKLQFQVFVKQEDEMLEVSRETQISPLTPDLIVKSSAFSPEKSVESGRLMKKPLRSDFPKRHFKELSPSPPKRINWTHREVEWFAAEKRLLFSALNSKELDRWISAINGLTIK